VFVNEAVVQVVGGVLGVEGLFCGEVGEPVGDGVAGGVEAVEGAGEGDPAGVANEPGVELVGQRGSSCRGCGCRAG